MHAWRRTQCGNNHQDAVACDKETRIMDLPLSSPANFKNGLPHTRTFRAKKHTVFFFTINLSHPTA